MLIKASRVRASAGAGALVRHLTRGDDNEEIVVVRGTVADMHDAVDDARRFNRVYALRHFVIAPEVAMTRQQFEQAAQALGDEFGFDPALALVVEHRKARAVASVSDRHWHLVIAETNAVTGRVLSSRFDHARHEKIARTLEVLFGHPILPGAHDVAVLVALRAEGKGDLADRLSSHLAQGERPIAAYSSAQHQAAKREGIDLAIIRENVRAALADASSGNELRRRLAAHGLAIERGDKDGTWIVRGPEGQFLGAGHRLAGLRKDALNTIMENGHDHRHQPGEPADSSPGDPSGHHGPAPRRGDDPQAGTGNGVADGWRGEVIPRRGDEPVADDRRRHRAEPHGDRGAASEAGRAGDRVGAAPDDGRGLIDAVATTGRAIMALAKGFNGQSPAEHTLQHLAALETQIRARIAAAEVQPDTATSSRLHAARLYNAAALSRHADVLKAYRAVQERAAAIPDPRRGVVDRLLGRPADSKATDTAEREVAAARAALVVAERAATSAEANLARVEKAEAAERGQRLSQVEAERRQGLEALAANVMAQRMVRVFPGIVYCGPGFVAWAGEKVERRRRRDGLKNPWARNIWGLPLDG